jgi:hypothetical protein
LDKNSDILPLQKMFGSFFEAPLQWSWSDALMSKQTEPRWERLKEEGNEHFKAGRLEEAEASYQDAIYLSMQPVPQINTLIVLGRRNPTSAMARFTDARLHSLLLSYLPKWIAQDKVLKQDDKLVVISMPNKAAAICHSNLATLQL